jgi:hypothetical protein
MIERVRRREDDDGLAEPADAYCSTVKTGNESCRFLHSGAVTKKRIKARGQACKARAVGTGRNAVKRRQVSRNR